jgi:hypothetical protein
LTLWQQILQWPLWAKLGAVIAFVVGSGTLGWWKYLRHERPALLAREALARPLPEEHGLFELRPCRWEINVANQIPLLSVIVWAINYSSETVTVGPSKVPYFRIDNVVVLGSMVDLETVTIGPMTSTLLFIRYKLVDSECRAIREHARAEICSAEMTFSTHWHSNDRQEDYLSTSPYNVLGVIVGVPARATPIPFSAPA